MINCSKKQELYVSELWKTIIIVITAITIVGLSIGLTNPLISLVLDSKGVSSGFIGLVASMSALGLVFVSPITPRIISATGTSKGLLIAILISSTSILLIPVFENYWVWLILRFILGCANGVLFATSETLINFIAGERNRGKLISLYTVVLSFGFAGGPVLIYLTGTQGAFPFVIAALILFTGAIPFIFIKCEVPVKGEKSSFHVFSFLKIAPLLCFADLMHAFLDVSAISMLPIFGIRHGLDTTTAALMVTVLVAGSTVFQIPIGWLADIVKKQTLLLICGIMFLIGSAALSFVIHDPLLLWPNLMLLGGAAGGIFIITLTIVGQNFKGAELVTANATLNLVWGVGSLSGPLITGFSMQVLNPDGFSVTLTIAALIFLVLFILTPLDYSRRR